MILLASAALSVLAPMSAGADTDLVVNSKTVPVQLPLSDMMTLKFVGGALQVKTAPTADPILIDLGSLNTLKFVDHGTTAIAQTKVSNHQISLSYEAGQLSAQGLTQADAALYNLGGQLMMRLGAWDGSAVSIASLPAGVYVFKVNNQTFKIVKK